MSSRMIADALAWVMVWGALAFLWWVEVQLIHDPDAGGFALVFLGPILVIITCGMIAATIASLVGWVRGVI